jgi:hypothetical protein
MPKLKDSKSKEKINTDEVKEPVPQTKLKEINKDEPEKSQIDNSKSKENNNNEGEKLQTDNPNNEAKKSQTKLRDFDDAWLNTYTWLRYNKETDLMTCAICIKFGKINIFTKGCQRKRIDALDEHVESNNHREAVSDEIESKRSQKIFDKVLEKKECNNLLC